MNATKMTVETIMNEIYLYHTTVCQLRQEHAPLRKFDEADNRLNAALSSVGMEAAFEAVRSQVGVTGPFFGKTAEPVALWKAMFSMRVETRHQWLLRWENNAVTHHYFDGDSTRLPYWRAARDEQEAKGWTAQGNAWRETQAATLRLISALAETPLEGATSEDAVWAKNEAAHIAKWAKTLKPFLG